MIRLGILNWGEYPGLSRLAECNHRVLIREKERIPEVEIGSMIMKPDVGVIHYEDGGRGMS